MASPSLNDGLLHLKQVSNFKGLLMSGSLIGAVYVYFGLDRKLGAHEFSHLGIELC